MSIERKAAGRISWTITVPASDIHYPQADGSDTTTQSSSMFHGLAKQGAIIHHVIFTTHSNGDTVDIKSHDGATTYARIEGDSGDAEEFSLGIKVTDGLSAVYNINASGSANAVITVVFTPLLQASARDPRASRYPILSQAEGL